MKKTTKKWPNAVEWAKLCADENAEVAKLVGKKLSRRTIRNLTNPPKREIVCDSEIYEWPSIGEEKIENLKVLYKELKPNLDSIEINSPHALEVMRSLWREIKEHSTKEYKIFQMRSNQEKNYYQKYCLCICVNKSANMWYPVLVSN